MIIRSTDVRGALRSRQRGFLLNPWRFVQPLETVLLANFNGSDGSTTFTDSSSYAHTMSVGASGAVLDTAQLKWGSASLEVPAVGHVNVADHASLRFIGADFTIECWVRISLTTGTRFVASKRNWPSDIDGWNLSFTGGGWSFSYSSASGTPSSVSFADTIPTSTWFHLAICRSGNSLFCFRDGTQPAASGAITATYEDNPGPALSIGGPEENHAPYSGWIDDFRITRGARYTANFTAPSGELSP